MDKLCECRCGGVAPLAKHTNKRDGTVKGQPLRFIKNHHTKKSGIPYRVEDRGYESACWVWQRGCNEDGYAVISVDGKSERGHAHYWKTKQGPVPQGLQLDHLCHVRACVNPDHMEAVTCTENNRRRKCAKLTMDKANQIRALCATGMPQHEIALAFGINQTGVSKIFRHETWA